MVKGNAIDAKGAQAIAKALTINSTLSSLQLAVSFTSLACTVPNNQYLLG